MAPVATVVCVSITWEGDHDHRIGFSLSGEGRGRAYAEQGGKAHDQGENRRCALLKNVFLQGKFLLFDIEKRTDLNRCVSQTYFVTRSQYTD